MGQLFITVERCLKAICKDGVSVLVHCSDGWDRTTQIISLCMLIADPHYRTFEGFRTLVQRQWIEFGHKFADRNGVLNGDENEKSPVFLQWLDCVYQLWVKNENCFQFNQRYLVRCFILGSFTLTKFLFQLKLLQHSYSGLFGSFLFNSIKEAADAGCVNLPPEAPLEGLSAYSEKPTFSRTFSIWSYLGSHNQEFLNPAFDIRQQKRYLNYPKHLADLKLWDDAYSYAPGFSLFGNSVRLQSPHSKLYVLF